MRQKVEQNKSKALNDGAKSTVASKSKSRRIFDTGVSITAALIPIENRLIANPRDLDAINQRGLVFEEYGCYEEALADFEQVLATQPEHPDALNNCGLALARLGRFEEALGYFNKTLLLYPERSQPRYNRSIMLLALGDLPTGFKEFETRWKVPPLKGVQHPSPVPLWLGESSLSGKTILVYHEQGYGDTLQFVRYVPGLVHRGAKVVLAVPPALRTLMMSLPGNPNVVSDGDPMPFHELRCPLMSLPLALGTTLENVPGRTPYLSADPVQASEWKARLSNSSKTRIGLVWSGRRYQPVNHPRDMPLEALRPLLDLDADFISLQNEVPVGDRELLDSMPKLARYGESLSDFASTAALIENLDLIVTVDTAVAHLAGALGKPVWLMNRHASCWRWLRDRTDSPWYPSIRQFRQKTTWDWSGVVAEVTTAAEEFIAQSKAGSTSSAIHVDALMQKGIAGFNLGNYKDALQHFLDALAIDKLHLSALNNAACTLVRLERRDEALEHFSKVLAIDPNHLEAQINRGAALNELHRHQEALAQFDQVLAVDPKNLIALNNRSCALANLNRLDEALTCYDLALGLDSNDPQTRFNRSTVLLTLGDFDRGFRDYESRWKLPAVRNKALRSPAPLWLGEVDLEGKTILLNYEQGLGDTIQFVRYVSLVTKRAERVVLRVPPPLRELMETLPGNVRVISDAEPLPTHDFHCPLMSLPHALGSTVETIPAVVPYLWASPTKTEIWKKSLGEWRRPRVGLVWSGRQFPPINYPRDMALKALLPLFQLDADFISLQKEIPVRDRSLAEGLDQLSRCGEALTDFADTAALVQNLDLVIAVDTSVAHLAGAIGKPVWIINRHAACWRWLRDRNDSPWYPTAKLFRQKSLGDWTGVVADVRESLELFIGKWKAERTSEFSRLSIEDVLQEGIVAFRQSDFNRAVSCFADVSVRDPRSGVALNNLACSLLRLGRASEAYANILKLLVNDPGDVQALCNGAWALNQLERYDEALTYCDRALETDPCCVNAQLNRGRSLAGMNRLDEALVCYDAVLMIDPRHVEAHVFKGCALGILGRHDEAFRFFNQALAINPRHLDALNNRGVALDRLGRLEEALADFDKMLGTKLADADALSNRALIIGKLGRHSEAVVEANRALDLNPEHVVALTTRATALIKLERYREAVEDCDKTLTLKPDHVAALVNRGLAFEKMGQHSAALASYDKALLINPAEPQARFNRSTVRLSLGDFAVGFREYEIRWELPDNRDPAPASKAQHWLGEVDLAGKTILLYHEQGLGDTIQFVRYVPLVVQRASRVILLVQEPLRALVRTISPNVQILSAGDVLPAHDLCCPLMSLPLAFGTTLETIPVQIPYLNANPKRVCIWDKRLGAKTKSRIGVAWAGRQYPPINYPRDISLKELVPLLDLDADFISLQKDVPEVDRELLARLPKLVRHGESLEDFADAAALIENVDLVITVDTSVAHLAGALGKPVWILNRFASCWRWLLERSDSPWYPNASLFRQKSLGDWAGVIADIRISAEAFIAKGAPFKSNSAMRLPIIVAKERVNGFMANVHGNKIVRDISQNQKPEKIKIVCATRMTSAEFFAKSALGRSLLNFREYPKGQGIEVRLFQKNSASLSSVYNIAIEESRSSPAILVFIHDDVLLCDFYWVEHLLQALDRFQIVGLSGNKRRIPRQPSWMYLDARFTCDDFSNLSGVVGHGEGFPNLTQLSVYGPPMQEVKLLDGVLLAARSKMLLEHDLRFDPQFDFDFYDMDFCRQAELRRLKMGTCAISVVHQSAGRLGKATWRTNYRKYLLKYSD